MVYLTGIIKNSIAGLFTIVPALYALFIHNYICHGRLTLRKKVFWFGVYILFVRISISIFSQFRTVIRMGIGFMRLSQYLEFTILECVMIFFLTLGVCIIVEPGVSRGKFIRYLKRFLGDIKKYFAYAVETAKAELRSEVANAYLDWLWWLIEPFCKMLIYTLIFGVIFNAAEQYFPVFIFSGLAMWNFFSRGIDVSVNVVRNNKSIISRVYLPKYILYLTRMFVNGFKMLVSFAIVVLMMFFFHVPISVNILYIIPVFTVFFLFTFGMGSILIHFGVYVNDLSYIVGIILNMVMYFTGIFYSVGKRIPEPFGELLEQFNPVAYFTASVRNALLYCQSPRIDLLIMWTLVSVMLLAIGVYVIYRNENGYVKVI